MIVETQELANITASAGTAFAGLILVFFGGVVSAFDSHEGKTPKVKERYRRKARLTFFAFFISLIAVLLSFWSFFDGSMLRLKWALALILLSALSMVAIAFLEMLEIK